MNVKRIYTLLLFTLCIKSFIIFGQQDVLYTNNNSFILYNPASNCHENGALNLITKHQFSPTNYNGNTFTLTYGQQIGRSNNVAGIVIDYNIMDFQKTSKYGISYSYKINLKEESTLSLGIEAEIYGLDMSLNKLGHFYPHDSLVSFRLNTKVFSTGLGLWYKNDKLYIGVSGMHLSQPRFQTFYRNPNFIEVFAVSSRLDRSAYFIAGYNYSYSSNVLIHPSVIYRHLPPQHVLAYKNYTEINRYGNATNIIDINLDFSYKERYLIGAGFRGFSADYNSLILKMAYTFERFTLQLAAILPNKTVGFASDLSLKFYFFK